LPLPAFGCQYLCQPFPSVMGSTRLAEIAFQKNYFLFTWTRSRTWTAG